MRTEFSLTDLRSIHPLHSRARTNAALIASWVFVLLLSFLVLALLAPGVAHAQTRPAHAPHPAEVRHLELRAWTTTALGSVEMFVGALALPAIADTAVYGQCPRFRCSTGDAQTAADGDRKTWGDVSLAVAVAGVLTTVLGIGWIVYDVHATRRQNRPVAFLAPTYGGAVVGVGGAF